MIFFPDYGGGDNGCDIMSAADPCAEPVIMRMKDAAVTGFRARTVYAMMGVRMPKVYPAPNLQ